MAITATTLTRDITAFELTIPVTSSTGATANFPMKIDNEYMWVVSIPTTTSVLVRSRGAEGTAALAHDNLANVQLSSAAGDFPNPAPGAVNPLPPWTRDLVTLGEDGTVTAANLQRDTDFIMDKATAAAITLTAPTKGQDGLTIVFTNQTAAAHVITATSLIADAVTGSPHTTITFGAFKGASIMLKADQGLWNVISAVVAVVT